MVFGTLNTYYIMYIRFTNASVQCPVCGILFPRLWLVTAEVAVSTLSDQQHTWSRGYLACPRVLGTTSGPETGVPAGGIVAPDNGHMSGTAHQQYKELAVQFK